MREIVSVHIGQAGVQIGTAAWDLLAQEHGLDHYGMRTGRPDALELNDSIFNVTVNGNYTPRALFIDSDPGTIDAASKAYPIFSKYGMVAGTGDYGCLFPSAYKDFASSETSRRGFDVFRKLLEESDCAQGVLITHSMSGGTGSGYTCAFVDKISDKHPKLPVLLFSLAPSVFELDRTAPIVAPYNIALMAHHSQTSSKAFILFDNPSLFNMCQRDVIMPPLKYLEANQLIAQVYDSVTSSYRLNTLVSANIQDIVTNLVPNPKMVYLSPSYAPIISAHHRQFENLSVSEVTNRCFEPANHMLDIDPRAGQYISTAFIYRGDVLPRDVNNVMYQTLAKKSVKFVNWVPCSVKVGITPAKPYMMAANGYMPTSLTACQISNSTRIKFFWCKLARTLKDFLAKKAFTHWYQRAGCSLCELQYAYETMSCLVEEYMCAESRGRRRGHNQTKPNIKSLKETLTIT